MINVQKVEEIKIKVPWGYLSGKWWGSKNVRPVLALHGWRDNAASFDTIIPLLPKHLSYLAIDFPGHGQSSHIPFGISYSTVVNTNVIHFVRKHYQWDTLSLMGHSMGAIQSFIYAGLFPEQCDMVITLDGLKPMLAAPETILKRMAKQLEEFYSLDQRKQKGLPSSQYEFDELVHRYVKGTNSSVTKEVAPLLIQRAAIATDGIPPRYYFVSDSRLKAYDFSLVPQEVSVAMAKRLKMPFLLIGSKQTPYQEENSHFEEVLNILLINNQLFKFVLINGKHHFLLTQPEIICKEVSDFLLNARPLL